MSYPTYEENISRCFDLLKLSFLRLLGFTRKSRISQDILRYFPAAFLKKTMRKTCQTCICLFLAHGDTFCLAQHSKHVHHSPESMKIPVWPVFLNVFLKKKQNLTSLTSFSQCFCLFLVETTSLTSFSKCFC